MMVMHTGALPHCSCAQAPAKISSYPSNLLLSRRCGPTFLSSRNSHFVSAFRLANNRRYISSRRRTSRRETARSEREEEEFESRSGEDALGKSSSAPVGDEQNERRGGSLSWLAQAFRQKSKEELEAEAEQKGTEILEVCQFLVNLVASETEHMTVVCKFPPGK